MTAAERLPFDIIAGVATGGIAHGVLVADLMSLPFIYVRSSKKKHGTGQQVEGFFEKGQRCLVIEDLISTGKSSLEAVDALREAGLVVNEVISIFTYGFEEAEKAFNDKNCICSSLTDYSTLLEEAISQEYIKEKDLKSLQKWRTNPRKWKKMSAADKKAQKFLKDYINNTSPTGFESPGQKAMAKVFRTIHG